MLFCKSFPVFLEQDKFRILSKILKNSFLNRTITAYIGLSVVCTDAEWRQVEAEVTVTVTVSRVSTIVLYSPQTGDGRDNPN